MSSLLLALFLLTSTWTETWQSGTANWVDGSGTTITCASTAGNVLHTTASCAAQAFSIYRWDQTQPVQVSGMVRGQPVGTTPYFCGLALIEASNHNVYGQAAVGRDILPVRPLDGQSWLVSWNGEYPYPGSKYFYSQKPVDPNVWQAFSVAWSPAKQTWTYSFGGLTKSNHDRGVSSPLTIDLQGAPLYDDGSECEFSTVTIVGARL